MRVFAGGMVTPPREFASGNAAVVIIADAKVTPRTNDSAGGNEGCVLCPGSCAAYALPPHSKGVL